MIFAIIVQPLYVVKSVPLRIITVKLCKTLFYVDILTRVK